MYRGFPISSNILALEMISRFWLFLCRNDLFWCKTRKKSGLWDIIFFGPPSYPQCDLRVFCPFCPLFDSFWGLYFGRGGRLYFHWPMYTHARRKPGPGGLQAPLSKTDKNEHLFSAVKLSCLTSSQRVNLKQACQHPSCPVCIKNGAVQTPGDWHWWTWRMRWAVSKFREHSGTSFFAYDFTAYWGIPRRYRRS